MKAGVIATVAGCLTLLAAGCATTPESVPELDQARATVRQLEAQDAAGSVAAESLSRAREALGRAQAALDAGEPVPVIRHQAYLARRHAEVGLETVNEAKAMEQVRTAEARRRELQLEARTMEARRAETEARQERSAAEASRQEALAARQEAERLQQELSDMQAEQTARGIVLTLGNNVLFETDSDELKPGAERSMDQLAAFLEEHPERRLMIEGHTDARGTDEHNRDLSERRAEAVADALEERGIPDDRLQTVGLGEAYPVASNDSSAGRQQNRRVEVVISDKQGRFPEGARRTVARQSGA
ncbi:MAG TPA: OmpA family protein [Woeseiaceae bacterium]